MSFEETKQSLYQRQRNILYLIEQYLCDFGLKNTHAQLCSEANLSTEFKVCDNIDLDTIYLDFCSYYHLKFDKQPKILKRVDKGTDAQSSVIQNNRSKLNKNKSNVLSSRKTEPEAMDVKKPSAESLLPEAVHGKGANIAAKSIDGSDTSRLIANKLQILDELPPDLRELTHVIERDIVKWNYNIKWDDVQGNAHAKEVLRECVVLPFKHPHLFANLTKPWKGVLMHGASGVGKTMMAKALCSETFGTVTFFNILSSTLISKWRGESEKFLKVLFTMAKFNAPSIIFIDEFESLASKRDSAHDHEATKRFKNELLIQIDELDSHNEQVLLLANTNLPWEIDLAFLRRLERKILIDMPDVDCRASIIKNLLPHSNNWSKEQFKELILLSDGFTGADLKIACKEASMKQLRKTLRKKSVDLEKVGDVTFDDLIGSLQQIKPTMSEMAAKHLQWNLKCGNQLI